MADEELRALQRAAASGDPAAQARYRRLLCRKNGHQWVHYKGGDHNCQVCGERSPGDPREAGAQTLYLDLPVGVDMKSMLMDYAEKEFGPRPDTPPPPPPPPSEPEDRGFDPFADLIDGFEH